MLMFRYTCWILIKVTCGNQERFLVCVPISNTLRNLQHNEENCVCDFIFLLVEGSHVFESPFYRDLISVSVTCMCFRSALCTLVVHHLYISMYIYEGQTFMSIFSTLTSPFTFRKARCFMSILLRFQ